MCGQDEERRRAAKGDSDRVVCVVLGADPFDPSGPLGQLDAGDLDLYRAAGALDAMCMVVSESVVRERPLVLVVCEQAGDEAERLVDAVRAYAPRAVVRLQRGSTLQRPAAEMDDGPPNGPEPGQGTTGGVEGGIVDDAELALLRALWEEGGEQAFSGAGGQR